MRLPVCQNLFSHFIIVSGLYNYIYFHSISYNVFTFSWIVNVAEKIVSLMTTIIYMQNKTHVESLLRSLWLIKHRSTEGAGHLNGAC